LLGLHAFYLFSNGLDLLPFLSAGSLRHWVRPFFKFMPFYVTIVMHRLEFMRLLGCITYGVIIVMILQHFSGHTIYLFAGGYGCIEANGGE